MLPSEEHLRKAKPEYLLRYAKWLNVSIKKSKDPKEEITFLIYGILRARKHLDRLPKGTIPSDIIKGSKVNV